MQTATNILSAIGIAAPSNLAVGVNAAGLTGVSGSDNSKQGSLSADESSSLAEPSFLAMLADIIAPAQTETPPTPLAIPAISGQALAVTVPNKLAISAFNAASMTPPRQAPSVILTGALRDHPIEEPSLDDLIQPGPDLDETGDLKRAEFPIDAQPVLMDTVVQMQVSLPTVPLVAVAAAAPQAITSPASAPATPSPAIPAVNAVLPVLNAANMPDAKTANLISPADAVAQAANLLTPIQADEVVRGTALPAAPAVPTLRAVPAAPAEAPPSETLISSNSTAKGPVPAQPILDAQSPAVASVAPESAPILAPTYPLNTATATSKTPPSARPALIANPPLPKALGDALSALDIKPSTPITVVATSKPANDLAVSVALVAKLPDTIAEAGLDTSTAAPIMDTDAPLALTNPSVPVADPAFETPRPVTPQTVPLAPTQTAKAPEPTAKPNLTPAPEAEPLPTQASPASAAEVAATDQASSVTAAATEAPALQAQGTRQAAAPVRTADKATTSPAQPAAASPNPSGAQGQASTDQNTQGQGDQDSGPVRLIAKAATATPVLVIEAKDTPVIQPLVAANQTQAASTDRQATATAQTVPMLATEIVRKSGGRSAQFDISLTPEGLGKVDVQISINTKGEVRASMMFDTPQAAAELRGRAAELQKSLEQSGFQVSQNGLSFSDTSRQGFGTAQQQAQHEQRQTPGQTRAFIEARDTAALTDLAAAKAYAPSNSRSIDVRI